MSARSRLPTSAGTSGPAPRSTAKRSLRGNSVDFPDRVVPMLPERICNDLCSLREKKDRVALAVRMVFGADGRKRSHTVSTASSCARPPSFPGRRSAGRLSTPRPIRSGTISASPAGAAAPVGRLPRPLPEVAQREPLDLDIRESGKSSSGADGAIECADHHAGAARGEPADRGVHDPGERRRGRDARESAKSPLVYRIHDAPSLAKLEALRTFLALDRFDFSVVRQLRPSPLQPGPGAGSRRPST